MNQATNLFTQAGKQAMKFLSDTRARATCTALALAAGVYPAHAQEFVDRVKNAKALDSTTIRSQATQAGNNWGAIIQIGVMLVGVVFCAWGIIWIAKAGRSEGRTPAGPGWTMAICGGALGGIMGVYAMTVGAFSGITG